LVTQRPPTRNSWSRRARPARIVVDAEPVLRDTLDNAEPVLRSTLDDAEPVLRSTFLYRWARGSDSRGHGRSQARKYERGTVTHRSVRIEALIFFLAGNPAPLVIFRLRFYQETSCAVDGENHCLVIGAEDISTTLKWC